MVHVDNTDNPELQPLIQFFERFCFFLVLLSVGFVGELALGPMSAWPVNHSHAKQRSCTAPEGVEATTEATDGNAVA